MAIRCIALDMDYTTLDRMGRLSPGNRAALERAIQKGIHIVIASGRDKNGTSFVYEPLGLEQGNHYLALVNGQIIYDFEKKI